MPSQPEFRRLLTWVHQMMRDDAQVTTGVPPAAYRAGYLDALHVVEQTVQLILTGEDPTQHSMRLLTDKRHAHDSSP